ncbi:hypothetical protein POTOM_004778 [Populus tomentosa]|uniref:Pentatricopeptide repeat-containing protein n=1 Tax=Populus tomentosa TaxID=118781 RepID=A0A8X8AI10_POPTO|nr:hypothetical protein POTOM_004778 [Populus tomentosa]
MATVELQLSLDPFAKLPITKASFELLSFSSIHMNVSVIIRHSGNDSVFFLPYPLHHPSVPVLTKISLSLARAYVPVPTSMILRNMPPLHILWPVASHTVKMDIGTLSGVKFLGSDVRWFLTLSSKRSVHAKVVKPDAMTFNRVLDACVRLKSSLKGQEIVDLMSQTGWLEMAHDILNEMDAAGDPIGFTQHMALLTAYYKAANNASSSSSKSDLIDFLVREMREEEKAVPSGVSRATLAART